MIVKLINALILAAAHRGDLTLDGGRVFWRGEEADFDGARVVCDLLTDGALIQDGTAIRLSAAAEAEVEQLTGMDADTFLAKHLAEVAAL